jgi:hypothetical protein
LAAETHAEPGRDEIGKGHTKLLSGKSLSRRQKSEQRGITGKICTKISEARSCAEGKTKKNLERKSTEH